MTKRTCSIEDCERDYLARGWCDMHYRRWRRHGDPTYMPFRRPDICIIDDCTRPGDGSRGWCQGHYWRWMEYGTPHGGGPTQIHGDDELRFWSYVDASGDCWEWTGLLSQDGYGRITIKGRNRTAHRVAWEWLVGPIEEETLDHLCRNRPCVNPDHLEPVSAAENTMRGYGLAAKRMRERMGANYPWR